MSNEIFLTIITILVAAIAYFLKRILDNTDKINDIAGDIAEIKPKVDILWEQSFSNSHSPRQLNDRGAKILEESGIKEIIEKEKEKLTLLVKAKDPKNPYDAEKVIMEVMAELPKHCPELVDKLKQGAFQTGSAIDVLLFVGGLYLRNLIFPELGFNLEELDKPIG